MLGRFYGRSPPSLSSSVGPLLVAEDLDTVRRYGLALGWELRRRTVLVEGTTDVELFQLAAQLELKKTGSDLLGADLAIVAAGVGDQGGTRGVIRELVCLRGFARTCLLPNGRPRYRFIGLFDNDTAGRLAVRAARDLDTSILEFKDVFRLWPVMPSTGNLDPATLQKSFEHRNAGYKGLDWVLEDLLPGNLFDAFLAECPGAVSKTTEIGGKTHRWLTRDGKARLHYFVKCHAMHADLIAVIEVLQAIRFYLCLPMPSVKPK